MICTLGFSKTNLVQFDAPRMTLCGAITGCDSLENTQFVVVLSSFVISPISGDLVSGVTVRTILLKIVPILITYVIIVARKAT
jgi:hypothetical protein